MINQILAVLGTGSENGGQNGRTNGWVVQIFYLPDKKMSREGTEYPVRVRVSVKVSVSVRVRVRVGVRVIILIILSLSLNLKPNRITLSPTLNL
jgi:hypothetical protein